MSAERRHDLSLLRESQRRYFPIAEAIQRVATTDEEREALLDAADEMLRLANLAFITVDGVAVVEDRPPSSDSVATVHTDAQRSYSELERALVSVADARRKKEQWDLASCVLDAVLAARPDAQAAKDLAHRIAVEEEAAEQREEKRREAEEARHIRNAAKERERRRRESRKRKKQREAERRAKEAEEARLRKERQHARQLDIVKNMRFLGVPAGSFTMGPDRLRDSAPERTVELSAFFMAKYPVTVEAYSLFVRETGYKAVKAATKGLQSRGSHPVCRVSWHDGVAFCKWASEIIGVEIRLPTEAEWEKAARGTDGRLYPWGNAEPKPSRCNYDRSVGDTTPVDKYSARSESPYGVADMAGNVWEWCGDWFSDVYCLCSGGRNPRGPSRGDERVIRGGSWGNDANLVGLVSATRRGSCSPDKRRGDLGFRCAYSE